MEDGWWWRCEFGRGEFGRGVGFGVGHGEVGVRDLVVVGAEAMGSTRIINARIQLSE